MKALVLGGTGFLGYHAVLELLRRGHSVSVLALDLPEDGLLPAGVEVTLADVNALDDHQLHGLFRGQEAIVYAMGVDDRVTPRAPAYDFFYESNVVPTRRIFGLARAAGVHRAILCSSYFSFFDREWPELELSAHHPYIRTRNEQAEAALKAGGSEMEVCVLELGYIFGGMPGRSPLWTPLVRYLESAIPLFYMKGGTNMVAVERVGEAIAGAVERGKTGRYQIGGENHSWTWLLEQLGDLASRKKRVVMVPPTLLKGAAGLLALWHALRGRESGLSPRAFITVQTRNTFLDPSASRAALGYGAGGLKESLRKTVEAVHASDETV